MTEENVEAKEETGELIGEIYIAVSTEGWTMKVDLPAPDAVLWLEAAKKSILDSVLSS